MRKILYIFFVLFMSNVAFADIIITNFDENVKFTDFGREVEVKIRVRVNVDANHFYKGWSYIFDKNSRIEVSEAKVIGRQFKTTFGNNELKFQFSNAFNGDVIEFHFKYLDFNASEAKYSRQEFVSLPQFAANAEGSLAVEIPNNLAVYSLNPKFVQNFNKYTWKGKVPNDGFSDIFSLTLRQAKWRADVLTQISGSEKISKIDITIPLYFKNGNNVVENYRIATNYKESAKVREDGENIVVNFDGIDAPLAQVKVSAILKNDFDNRVWIKLDPNKYLEVDERTSRSLYDVVYRAQVLNQNKPLYIALAEWVHSHIKYDDSYVGQEMDTMKIVSLGRGVCIHYAQLYNDLLRSFGIPSIIVSGESYDNEKNKFEAHAWNLVYVNGEWISIDPTWGVYSGKLPVSHIFFYFNDRNAVKYTIYGTSSNSFKSDIKKNIEFLE